MQSACCDSEAPGWLLKLSCGQKVYMFAKAVLDRPTPSPDQPEPPQVESCDIVLGEACLGMCVHMLRHVCMWACMCVCVCGFVGTHVCTPISMLVCLSVFVCDQVLA